MKKIPCEILAMIVLGLFVLVVTWARANELPSRAEDNAHKYLWVKEKTNKNDHLEIDKMLGYLGLPKGLSWCAAFSLYNYKEAADELRVKQPFPRYGRVAMLWEKCKANPLRYKTITADDVRFRGVHLLPGDLPVWANGSIRDGDFNGHTGLVISQSSPMKFLSIEGNTMPSNKGNQRDGGGVYVRERVIAPGSFRILGFCRPI